MSVFEWLLWVGLGWGVFLAYAAVDAPALIARMRGRR